MDWRLHTCRVFDGACSAAASTAARPAPSAKALMAQRPKTAEDYGRIWMKSVGTDAHALLKQQQRAGTQGWGPGLAVMVPPRQSHAAEGPGLVQVKANTC